MFESHSGFTHASLTKLNTSDLHVVLKDGLYTQAACVYFH